MQNEAELLIDKLLNYYNVSTISELAEILKTKQTSISSWKSRKSVNAIKKKCRQLGIYREIFDEFIEKTNNSNNINSESKAYQALFETAYNFAKINGTEDKLKQLLKDFI